MFILQLMNISLMKNLNHNKYIRLKNLESKIEFIKNKIQNYVQNTSIISLQEGLKVAIIGEPNVGKSSIFNKAPTSATIRLEVFNRFDGFSGKQHIGDFELWHKLSLTENVLLLPHGIVWSREHDEQESKANRTDSYVLFKYMLVSKDFLQKVHNPLELSLKNKAINRINRSISRSILRSVFIERNLSKALLKRNASSMTIFQIIYFSFFVK